MDITIKHQYRLALYTTNKFNADRVGVDKDDKVPVWVHGLFQVGDEDATDAAFICEVYYWPNNNRDCAEVDKSYNGVMLYADPLAIQFIDGGPYA